MKNPEIYVVIGKNFGDEGKGRVVDFLSRKGKNLVVRHNGGAQSGHTVIRDDKGNKSFIFHELGAGSFNEADTLWTDTFFPDLYKLNEECAAFYTVSGIKSSIFCVADTPVTTVCDVLINMAMEKSRGEGRHGSCGMGIYEASLRTKAGFGITMSEVKSMDEKALFDRLLDIRKDYVLPAISKRHIDENLCAEYLELIRDDNVLENAASEMCRAAKDVTVVDNVPDFLGRYDKVIFETGQGLLLDSENEEYAPHVTGSRTGLTNPAAFLKRFGYDTLEVVYVTRSYMTRHGAGLLKHECDRTFLGIKKADSTNVTNDWQGSFRYAPHDSIEDFLNAPMRDVVQSGLLRINEPEKEITKKNASTDKKTESGMRVSLAITHLSDTDDSMLFADGDGLKRISEKEFCESPDVTGFFNSFYTFD